MTADLPESTPRLRICPGGPLLVQGATSVTTGDGRVHEVHRAVVALCRCGSSARRPYCDGTHKLLGREGRRR
jgi:CDGSH-type Zn-finger protein